MKIQNLLILGAGQYGCVAREIAQAMGCFACIDFLDDNHPAAGKLADYERLTADYGSAVVAMGNPALRLHWIERLESAGYEIPILVHPMAYVSPSAVLAPGTIVEPMAVVQANAVVKTGGLLCAGCVVNHNAVVEAGCQIDCSAVVAANAVVPAGTKVPSGTVCRKT